MPFGFERKDAEAYDKKIERNQKKYIELICWHTLDGKVIPKKLLWEDYRVFEIDKILDIRKAASVKSGGMGIRYRCKIMGQVRDIFFDLGENRWFIE